MSDAIVVSLVTTMGVVVAAAVPTITTLRTRKDTKTDLHEIHTLVNGRLDAALEKIERLEAIITKMVPAKRKI